MNFSEAIESGFQNYVELFRARQPLGIWYWALFMLICGIVA